jgi:hypothetical protein
MSFTGVAKHLTQKFYNNAESRTSSGITKLRFLIIKDGFTNFKDYFDRLQTH